MSFDPNREARRETGQRSLHAPSLAIVIPAYNEAEHLPALLRDWQPILNATGVPYTIVMIDDGSTDDSLAVLKQYQATDPRLQIEQQQNAGHGPAILKGYDLARNAEWVFQIDSDHQLDPAAFSRLWESRSGYDLLLGQRREEHASPGRRWLSRFAVYSVRWLYGAGIKDANCPYRLMRGVLLQEALKKIPPNSFAPNILLTSWFIRKKSRIFTTVVNRRAEGQRPGRLNAYMIKGALLSGLQTILFRLRS
jgi:glycosyltransferase involved in cell wall biosynthesis